jgi:hypothetical protein
MSKKLPETCWTDLGDQEIVIFASSWFLYYFTFVYKVERVNGEYEQFLEEEV